MSNAARMPIAARWRRRGASVPRILMHVMLWLVLFPCFLSIIGIGIDWVVMPLWALLSGWVRYPLRVLPQVSVDHWGLVLATGALALTGLLLHHLAGWAHRERQLADGVAAPASWRIRWTAAILALVLTAFAIGTALVGIVHQAVWLATTSEDLTSRDRRFGHQAVRHAFARLLDNRKADGWTDDQARADAAELARQHALAPYTLAIGPPRSTPGWPALVLYHRDHDLQQRFGVLVLDREEVRTLPGSRLAETLAALDAGLPLPEAPATAP